jgi:hypothetical protein
MKLEPQEQTQEPSETNPFDSSNEPTETVVNPPIQVDETPVEELKEIKEIKEDTPKTQQETFELEIRECEILYGTLLELGHALKSKKESKALPEARVKRQGKIMYDIFKRYDITIPNIDLAVLAVGAVADWKYLTTNEIDNGDDDLEQDMESKKPDVKEAERIEIEEVTEETG